MGRPKRGSARPSRAKDLVPCEGSGKPSGLGFNDGLYSRFAACPVCDQRRYVNINGKLAKHSRVRTEEQAMRHARVVKPALDEQERREWVAMLGPTPILQLASIYELLHYASDDRMSARDRVVCVEELRKLEAELNTSMDYEWAVELLHSYRFPRKVMVPADASESL